MNEIVEKGLDNITIRGKKIPAWFVDKLGRRFEFKSMAVLDRDGRFDITTLPDNQCIMSPGAIYELKS